MPVTLFRYKCGCGSTNFLQIHGDGAQCESCGKTHPRSASGVIDFIRAKTDQNAYFDEIYSAGRFHKVEEFDEYSTLTYRNTSAFAEKYLTLCGCDFTHGVEGLSVLDAACGSGWITAGLLQHPAIRNSKFHAFDISAEGLELLARFERGGEIEQCR